MTNERTDNRYELTKAGIRVIAARTKEATLSILAFKYPGSEIHLADWSRAHRHLEDCQQEYINVLERFGFPELPIRSLVEGESDDVR